MEHKPPLPPFNKDRPPSNSNQRLGTPADNNQDSKPLINPDSNHNKNIYKPNLTGSSGFGNANFNPRSNSRGGPSDYARLDIAPTTYNPSYDPTVNNAALNPTEPQRLNTGTGRKTPLNFKNYDPNNPMSYGDGDNLRKLRNDVYRKHNYGREADNPFNDFNLLEMNNDDELEKQRIKNLEEDIDAKKRAIELAKMKLEKKQLYDLYQKENTLLDRLDELKREKEEDGQLNSRIREQIVRMKMNQQQELEEQKGIDRMMWNIQRDKKMEEIVRKKLELERLQENTKYIDEMRKRRELEIEQIEKEKKERDLTSAELLQKALKHADVLQDQIDAGVVDEGYQALLVDALSGDKADPENQQLREELLEELKSKILQQKERKTMENQKFIQDLNNKRMEFSNAEKKINEQKLLHQALTRRGVDFLAELELGNAPPMDYVIKNLNVDDKKIEKREPFSIKDIVETTKNSLQTNEDKLVKLREERAAIDPLLKDLEYKPEPMFLSDTTQEIIDYILDILLDKAWVEVSLYDQYVDDLKRKAKIMKSREPVQEARIAYYSDRLAMKQLNNEIVEKVVKNLLREVATEADNVNESAKLTALRIISKAYIAQNDTEINENDLAGILITMQMQQVKEKNRDFHVINHNLAPVSKDVFVRPSNIKQEEKKKEKKKQPKDLIEEQDRKDDLEALRLDPNECETKLPSSDLKNIELEFWSRIEIKPQFFFGGTAGRQKGGITALDASNDARYVA